MPPSRSLVRPHVLPRRRDPEAFRRIYRAEVLGLPGPVDRWLVTNARTGGSLNFLKDYMYKINLSHDENVLCCVKRHITQVRYPISTSLFHSLTCLIHKATQDDTDFINPPKYTLTLTCSIASTRVPSSLQKSPTVYLDHFIRFNDELDAPDWVNWEKPVLEYYQPRAIIAETFVHLSGLSPNQRKVSIRFPSIDRTMISHPPTVRPRCSHGQLGESYYSELPQILCQRNLTH